MSRRLKCFGNDVVNNKKYLAPSRSFRLGVIIISATCCCKNDAKAVKIHLQWTMKRNMAHRTCCLLLLSTLLPQILLNLNSFSIPILASKTLCKHATRFSLGSKSTQFNGSSRICAWEAFEVQSLVVAVANTRMRRQSYVNTGIFAHISE